MRIACLALMLSLPACESPPLERVEQRQLHMGTELRLVLYAPSPAIADEAAAAAFRRVAELDSILSDYRADSELARLDGSAARGPVRVGADLLRVVARAVDIARATGGAFDPTLGPLTRLWREARRTGAPPDSSAIESAREVIGWRMVAVDTATRTIALERAGMRLDLGGIAKGYAADEALKVVRAGGIDRALVVFGGEIVAGDPPPGERGWRIELPSGAVVRLANEALSASGDAEQFLVIDGVRRSHVIDPVTGLGLEGGAGAVVIARDGMTADALATAAGIVERDEAERWMSGAAARLVEHRAAR